MNAVPLLIAAAVGFLALERAIRDSSFAAALILTAVVLNVGFRDVYLIWGIGPFSVHPMDVVAGLILTAGVARLLRAGQPSGRQLVLIAVGVLVVASLLLGITEAGVNAAIQEARKFIYLISVALYFTTVEPRREVVDRLAKLWVAAACVLLGTAIMRWLVMPLGLVGPIYGWGHGMRVLPSAAALFLLHAFFLALLAWRRGGSPWWGRLALALLVAIVLLQHRSVWGALLVGILLVAVRDRLLARHVAVLILAAVLTGGVFITVVFGEASNVTDQLADSAQNETTFMWRYEGWKALLEGGGVEHPAQALVGQPFGSGFDRNVGGRVTGVSPHSFYVETYLRLGFLGLALLGVAYAQSLWRLARTRTSAGLFSAEVLLVLLVNQLVYFIAYDATATDGLLLGLAMAMTAWGPRVRDLARAGAGGA